MTIWFSFYKMVLNFAALFFVVAVTVAYIQGKDDEGIKIFERPTVVADRFDSEIPTDKRNYQHNGIPEQSLSRTKTVNRSYTKTRWKDGEWEHFEPGIKGAAFVRRIRSSNLLIAQRFGAKIISPGEDISLQCTATADRPPRFTWERDGVVISTNTDSRYTIGQMMSTTGLGVTAQLNITRTRVEDGGLYSCVAVEGDGTAVHTARIDVYGPPYIRTLPPIKVQSGESLKLRCPYYGYPISKLEWENKGKKILTATLPHISRYKRSYENNIKSKRRKNYNSDQNSKGNDDDDDQIRNDDDELISDLKIDKYDDEIKDNHKTVKNDDGGELKGLRRRRRQIFDNSDEGVLNIQKLEKEDNGESYMCIVYSPSGEMARRAFEIQVVEAPLLDELRMGTGLKEGQIVQITCNIISGDPPIYFSWLKDGKKIPPNLKINERSSELFSVLIIKRVALEHCGQYTCIATNHVGKVNQTSDLYINVAPKWLLEPSNTSLLLGERGAVSCLASGYPAPHTHWMKRDANLGIWRPVLDLAGGGVMSYPNGTLIIEVVSLSDEGLYSCNVENGVGEALNKNLWINVNKPVHFESVGMNLTTKKGLPINLTCKPLGDSPIRIKWTLDGRLLDFTTSRLTISETALHNGVKNTLSISYTESKDAGNYECRASNPYGVASYIINLEVLEPPSPPSDIQLSSVTSNSARLSWRQTPAQYYTIHYTTGNEAARVINISRQDDIIQTTELKSLQPSTDYLVRVSAGNQVDVSVYTEPLHFTTMQEAPSSPPLGIQVQQTDTPGELSISWLPPNKEAQNGPLQGYHVRAVPRISGEQGSIDAHTKTMKVISRKGKQEYIMGGLLKNTRYAVSISAFNLAGNGPFSLPVYQTTREGAPEQSPSNIECRGVSSTSIRVSWQPLNVHGSSLLGYSIYYGTDDGPWQNISSPHTEIYLQSLLKYTNYTVKIAGFSNYGVGPFSYPVVCTTLQDVPGPPAAIKVLMSSPTSILVSWKRPEHPNGEITHYTIHVKMMSSSTSPQTFRVDPSPGHLTYSVPGLAASKQYEVYVRAHTAVGEGGASSRVHVDLGMRGSYFDENKVVAGVASLGGPISTGAGSSLLLQCTCVGSPPPRTVWYHQHNIITHHPRFTRNHDDSLLINNIDQSLSGNYTCLAKNMFGSDSVSYEVSVLPTPEPPTIRVTPNKNSLYLQWDEQKKIGGRGQKIVYSLSWKESTGSWQDAFTNQGTSIRGLQEYTLEDLKCGTKYSIRMIAANSVGSSQPAYIDASTLGGVPIPPSTTEWLWSNSSHISIQLSGWDDNGCEVHTWRVEYRSRGGSWRIARTPQDLYSYSSLLSPSSTFTIGSLSPATWYQIRITAENSAGSITSVYNYATTTILGASIAPPSDYVDVNTLVIVVSVALLFFCSVTCVYILVKRHHSQHRLTSYRNSLTAECKSERSNVTVNTPQTNQPDVNNRVYSTPVHLHADAKHELYEISPYAQFALGFRTFGHVDNNEAPRHNIRYDSETSFQMRSESEESDCVSRTTTLKSAPRKACRIPHHR